MVYTESQVSGIANQLEWKFNIPFREIPQHFVEQFTSFTYEQFLLYGSLFDVSPFYWNIAAYLREEPVIFCWGLCDPLERAMLINRVCKHRALYNFKGSLLKELTKQVRLVAGVMGAQRVIFLTTRSKAFEKKLDGEFFTSNTRVMELQRDGLREE